jgi:hypothetical protein
VRFPNDEIVETLCHMPARGRVAEPPALGVVQHQVFAEQRLGEMRQIGTEPAVLHHGRPDRIDDEIG